MVTTGQRGYFIARRGLDGLQDFLFEALLLGNDAAFVAHLLDDQHARCPDRSPG